MENWQPKKANESEKNKKMRKRKKNNVRNSEGKEEEATWCWVKFRFMVCCVPSTSDVDSSLSLSRSTGMTSSSSWCFLWSILFYNSSSMLDTYCGQTRNIDKMDCPPSVLSTAHIVDNNNSPRVDIFSEETGGPIASTPSEQSTCVLGMLNYLWLGVLFA